MSHITKIDIDFPSSPDLSDIQIYIQIVEYQFRNMMMLVIRGCYLYHVFDKIKWA